MNIVGIVSFFLQNYTFLPKDASILGKMFESEEDKNTQMPTLGTVIFQRRFLGKCDRYT